MKKLYQTLFLAFGALAIAGTACAQVPSTNDTTGNNGNTGGGTFALGNTSGYYNTAYGSAALYNNTSGSENTASGYFALNSNTTGGYNTASGYFALRSNTTGSYNTASGLDALFSNTTGSYNTASGSQALYSNTTSIYNAAFGYLALYNNTTAGYNTAAGAAALYSNTTGANNTAFGARALESNTTANNNTASGYFALYSNSTGSNNTASGKNALYSNTTGFRNAAVGSESLVENTTGKYNTAFGHSALSANTTGSYNIAIGYSAGSVITGSNDIDIGSTGVAADSGIIRIGTKGTQTAAYIAGIATTALTGSTVVVTASGQLGVLSSSERYKTAITAMDRTTEKLQRLRPVSFHLKADPKGPVQYGLIAEEVEKVYPELVIRDEAGNIQGVRYDELAPMLLNEMQKKNVARDAEIRDLKRQLEELKGLKQQVAVMSTALQKLQVKDELMAQR